MKVVAAIGGNALVEPEGSGDIHAQFERSRKMAMPLADLVEAGYQLTLTHGNGPQVGSVMRRVELASNEVYPIDLGLAVANTQAGMGYMIAQTLTNELRHRGIRKQCTALVTTVVVNENSPAFRKPTKPIGWFMDEETSNLHRDRDGWQTVEDSGRGYRRVVPSPPPLWIPQMDTIKRLVDAGELLIAGGGGGIPVVEDKSGDLRGVEAVVDKDLTSAMIAAGIAADVLTLVTSVESVFINYRTADQVPLREANVEQIKRYIAEGQFPAGSMLPKVEAAIQFLEAVSSTSAKVIITDLFNVPAALAGRTGTVITI